MSTWRYLRLLWEAYKVVRDHPEDFDRWVDEHTQPTDE